MTRQQTNHGGRIRRLASLCAAMTTFASVGQSASAADWSARLSLSLANVDADELVYEMDGRRLSELNWSAKNVPMLGLGVSVTPIRWLKLNLDYSQNLTAGDGDMLNRDWVVPGLDWTHQSTHPSTELQRVQSLDVNAEMAFLQWHRTLFLAAIGYRWDSLEWESRGGRFTYSWSGFRDTAGSIPEVASINYEQDFHAPYLALRVRHDWKQWTVNGRVQWSPFVSAKAKDVHHLRTLQIKDSFEHTTLYGLGLSVSHFPSSNLEISGFFDWTTIEEANGKKIYSNLYTNHQYESVQARGGTSLDSVTFGLNVSYYF